MNADLLQTGQNRCGGQPCVAACHFGLRFGLQPKFSASGLKRITLSNPGCCAATVVTASRSILGMPSGTITLLCMHAESCLADKLRRKIGPSLLQKMQLKNRPTMLPGSLRLLQGGIPRGVPPNWLRNCCQRQCEYGGDEEGRPRFCKGSPRQRVLAGGCPGAGGEARRGSP